jgi:two-component system response regulator
MPKVLLVEDNEMNRDMLSRRLIKKGFAVVFATDAEQALSMVRVHEPDVIIMDISLPGMNGWDATKRLKEDPATARYPVLALTAHAMSEDRDRAFQVGCDDYETKPVDFPALIAKIDRILSKGGKIAG